MNKLYLNNLVEEQILLINKHMIKGYDWPVSMYPSSKNFILK